MRTFNPMFNTLNMTRNITPFATAGSSIASSTFRNSGFLSRGIGSKITLSGILTGAQKTIGTVNQIVPLYNQVKPMFENSKVLLNVIKGFKGTETSKNRLNKRNQTYFQNNTIDITPIKKEENKKKADGNLPSKPFFVQS